MQYAGGKTRIAKFIVPHLIGHGRPVWDAFAGGLAISSALHAAGARVLTCDVRKGLITLYQKCVAGDWTDTRDCSREEYAELAAAKDPDCPRTAFVSAACSFGGKYFGGYAAPNSTHPRGYAHAGRELLRKKLGSHPWVFECMSFFDLDPGPEFVVYCDPPYRGTIGYGSTFDTDAFDHAVLAWGAVTPTFVSEYELPIGRVVWERASTTTLGAGVQGGKTHTERLYRIY